jgi:hypothetical protein
MTKIHFVGVHRPGRLPWGHVEVAISMVLADMGNFMSAMFERKKGNIEGGILDVLKTLLHGLLGVLTAELLHVQSAHAVPMNLVIGELK